MVVTFTLSLTETEALHLVERLQEGRPIDFAGLPEYITAKVAAARAAEREREARALDRPDLVKLAAEIRTKQPEALK